MSPLVLTPGDPDGIGPEVTAQALVGLERPVVVVGDAAAFSLRGAGDAVVAIVFGRRAIIKLVARRLVE